MYNTCIILSENLLKIVKIILQKIASNPTLAKINIKKNAKNENYFVRIAEVIPVLFPKLPFIVMVILFCFNTFRKSLYNAII